MTLCPGGEERVPALPAGKPTGMTVPKAQPRVGEHTGDTSSSHEDESPKNPSPRSLRAQHVGTAGTRGHQGAHRDRRGTRAVNTGRRS